MVTSLPRQSPCTWVQILRKCGRILASTRNSFRTSTETQRPSIPDQKQLETGDAEWDRTSRVGVDDVNKGYPRADERMPSQRLCLAFPARPGDAALLNKI